MVKSAMVAQSLSALIYAQLTAVVELHLINWSELFFVKMIWITFG